MGMLEARYIFFILSIAVCLLSTLCEADNTTVSDVTTEGSDVTGSILTTEGSNVTASIFTTEESNVTDSFTTNDPNANTTTVEPTTLEPYVTTEETNTTTEVSPTTESSQTTQGANTTVVPAPVTTDQPCDNSGQHFDIGSFIGGIILTLGITVMFYFGCYFYRKRTEANYHQF